MAARYGGLLVDIDGVVRRGTAPIPGAGETLAALHAAGLPVVFVTNNAAPTPQQVVADLDSFGVPADVEQIVTSAMAAAAMLEPGTRCVVIGMDGLRAALRDRGCVEVTDPTQAEAVLVGLDRTFDFAALRTANTAIRHGARFIATNTDPTFPAAGEIAPGNGAIVAAVQTASGVAPEVAGKPHAPLLLEAARRVGTDRVLMVGDRHETDIAGAAALGWDTALVLTGITTAEQVPALVPPATYVVDSIADLLTPAN